MTPYLLATAAALFALAGVGGVVADAIAGPSSKDRAGPWLGVLGVLAGAVTLAAGVLLRMHPDDVIAFDVASEPALGLLRLAPDDGLFVAVLGVVAGAASWCGTGARRPAPLGLYGFALGFLGLTVAADPILQITSVGVLLVAAWRLTWPEAQPVSPTGLLSAQFVVLALAFGTATPLATGLATPPVNPPATLGQLACALAVAAIVGLVPFHLLTAPARSAGANAVLALLPAAAILVLQRSFGAPNAALPGWLVDGLTALAALSVVHAILRALIAPRLGGLLQAWGQQQGALVVLAWVTVDSTVHATAIALIAGLVGATLALLADSLVGADGHDELDRLAGAGARAPLAVALLIVAGTAYAWLPPWAGFQAVAQLLTGWTDGVSLGPTATIAAIAIAIGWAGAVACWLRMTGAVLLGAAPGDIPGGRPRRTVLLAASVPLVGSLLVALPGMPHSPLPALAHSPLLSMALATLAIGACALVALTRRSGAADPQPWLDGLADGSPTTLAPGAGFDGLFADLGPITQIDAEAEVTAGDSIYFPTRIRVRSLVRLGPLLPASGWFDGVRRSIGRGLQPPTGAGAAALWWLAAALLVLLLVVPER